MENPLSWNIYQKAIAFHSSNVPPGLEENIVDGLIDDKLMDLEQRPRALEVIKEAYQECKRQRVAKSCGLSNISIIYYALKEAGLLP
jgi:hypothetical protein